MSKTDIILEGIGSCKVVGLVKLQMKYFYKAEKFSNYIEKYQTVIDPALQTAGRLVGGGSQAVGAFIPPFGIGQTATKTGVKVAKSALTITIIGR